MKNKLLWKLLRQHVSPFQLIGFFLANFIGTVIVLLGYQFYHDVQPLFTAADGFMQANYLIVSKHIGTSDALSSKSHDFTRAEIDEFASLPFIKEVGVFTSTEYKATVTMGLNGETILHTDMFFESVPDRFAGVPDEEWLYSPGDSIVPVVVPRAWLTVYNFGFARLRSLPAVSDGLASSIRLDIEVGEDNCRYVGRVVAFSSRTATLLVPQSFVDDTNNRFAPGRQSSPTRLIVETISPADPRIAGWLEDYHLETDENQQAAGKVARLLQLLTTIVVSVGVLIVLLSLFVLLLSIHLLMQKNKHKTETLLLLGYSRRSVARPYHQLAIGLYLLTLIFSIGVVAILRPIYMQPLFILYPQLPDGSLYPTIMLAGILASLLVFANYVAICRKVKVEKG